ncbi:hypothetical protein H6G51_02280 [Limnothrix sp. FACHB-708]|uniref:hypothetical protein n=1 Tax=unclassified Limnothrix TaxID=2632864 RepID=UPI0016874C81|nr:MULTISPECIES: hypothetical protein [unclassified Limnothrix]MBD2552097.1 hypothetical protein [Limnothrix sp. FACHB-708]MBD2589777.1 hypothetical protein [Limnothrix sp. FACHB-406]
MSAGLKTVHPALDLEISLYSACSWKLDAQARNPKPEIQARSTGTEKPQLHNHMNVGEYRSIPIQYQREINANQCESMQAVKCGRWFHGSLKTLRRICLQDLLTKILGGFLAKFPGKGIKNSSTRLIPIPNSSQIQMASRSSNEANSMSKKN